MAEAIPVESLPNLILGGIAVSFIAYLLANVIDRKPAESQKRVITSIAFANGLIFAVGISPFSRFASELVTLTPFLTPDFPAFVGVIVAIGTVADIVYGLGKMLEGSDSLGIAAFSLAFVGGCLVAYRDTAVLGVFLTMLALISMDLAPTKNWW